LEGVVNLARVAFVIILIGFIAVFSYFVYSSIANAGNVPKEIKETAEYPIAIADALKLRFVELPVAAILFPLIAFGMALGKLPSISWLRNLLAAALTVLLVFTIFSKLMEDRFRERFAGASLPLEGIQTAFDFCLVGVLFSFLIFFVTERIHVWRLGK
jgi:hypothetical protein